MVDTGKWYILQVKSGKEAEVKNELLRRGVQAVVPIENRLIRRSRKWITKEYVVFVGYVFIKIMYTWSQYYILSGINGVIRLLGGGKHPEPLMPSEVEWVQKLTEILKEPSVLKLTDNGYEIISGVLKDLQNNIVKIERRYRRAIVKLTLGGKETVIKLSFTLQIDNNK